MMREAYMEARDELVYRYLEIHPDATEEEAENAVEHRIMDVAIDMLCDRADSLRDREKYNG